MAASIHKTLVFVGDALCGKTALIETFFTNKFPEGWINSTVYGHYTGNIEVDNKQVDLEVWDTSGSQDYDRLRPLSYPNTDVFLLCFSVDRKGIAFSNITEKWLPEVKQHCPDVPIILVANEIDLRNDEYTKNTLKEENQELVTTEEGRAMAEHIGAYAYMECSALTKEGVREVFETAVDATLERPSYGETTMKCSCCLLL